MAYETSFAGWTCQKCGRTGLTSVTLIGGLATCAYCVHEIAHGSPVGSPLRSMPDGVYRVIDGRIYLIHPGKSPLVAVNEAK